MTRRAIIELIKYRLKNVDSTEQFAPQYIQGVCDLVWSSWSTESLLDDRNDPNFFTKKYDAVAVTEGADEYYSSSLPEKILALTRVGGGVLSINQINAKDNDFKPVLERDFRLSKGQEVARTGSDIYFYVTFDSVFYNESMTSDIASSGVDMRLAIPFSKYGLEEELPMPSGREAEFVESVVNMLMGTPPTNLSNKNSDV